MPRRIVVAPDKFKGSLSARDATDAIVDGLSAVWPAAEYAALPMADGGEGTVDTFLALPAWHARRASVRGPLGARVDACFAMSGSTAVIEMAAASGLAQVQANETRGARDGSSFGTGELVRAALDCGATRIVIGVGGSATNDGGAGALAALGARLLDARDREIAAGGIGLARLARIDLEHLDSRLRACELELATDVENPLVGPRGASVVFGPQKGATPHDVTELDAALTRFAAIVAASGGNDTRSQPGAGAGGGIAFGLSAFLHARVTSGFALVADAMALDAAIDRATLCCTGEGAIDAQTLGGKVVAQIALRARARAIACYAFGGRIERSASDALAQRGCQTIAVNSTDEPIARALQNARGNLTRAARSLARRLSN